MTNDRNAYLSVFTQEMLNNAVPKWWQVRRRIQARRFWREVQSNMSGPDATTSFHGGCGSFWEALPMNPPFICSNCGHPRWQHNPRWRPE